MVEFSEYKKFSPKNEFSLVSSLNLVKLSLGLTQLVEGWGCLGG